MNKLKSWRNLALILLAIFGVSFSIFLTQPSDATQAKYERMIELGFIDEVKTPEELGLDYLHRRPPQLTAGLVDSIRQVRDEAETQMTDDIRVAIPLGENDPFPVGALPNDNNYGGENISSLEEVGYLNPSGQPEPVTGGDIVEMMTVEANNGGSFDALKTREILVADASGSFLQARRVKIIDLIVRDWRNGKYYLLPNIRVDSFCRDALNAVSNETWWENDVDVSRLNLRPL
jgi:hypothetical protein